MNRRIRTGMLLLALAGQAGAQPPAVDELSQPALQAAFQILQSEYIRGADLTLDELNRAALQGLLARLDLGAELVPVAAAVPAAAGALVAERLTPAIACLRPRSWAAAELELLDGHLRDWGKAAVPHLILDLRSPAAPGEPQAAAALLERFVPRGELLFQLKQVGREEAELFIAGREPLWPRPLLVLVDAETGNLGETVAAVLQARGQALVVGARTRGATVRYETLPLDARWRLRFARAEMLLRDGRSLFREGVRPDFPVDLPLAVKRPLFAVPAPVLKASITERARPRYNEAALIARHHPELDSYVRRSLGQPEQDDRPALQDRVLQRATDLLEASLHLGAAAGPASPPPSGKP